MFNKLLWVVTFSLSLLISQVSFADSHDCKKGLSHIVDSLNLTSDQKAKVKPILEQLKSSVNTSASQMKSLRDELNQQIHSANMDESVTNGLIDKKVKLIGDVIKAKATAAHQVYVILDDKQKAQAMSLVKEMEAKMADKYAKCSDED